MALMSKNPAGFYTIPLQHLVRTTSKDTSGGTEYTFSTDGAVYFGNVVQTVSQEFDNLGRIQTVTHAVITLKGWYVEITPLDRLLDLLWNETWVIDSVARGQDEYIIEAHNWEAAIA